MGITVHRAEASEADTLAPILSALCRRSKAHWGYEPALLARWADDLRIEPADIIRDAVLVAATADGGVAGFARVTERPDHSQLHDLWVEPAHIGTGVGRILWTAAVSVARSLPFDDLRFAADPNAEAFYEHMGARRIGDVPSEVVQGRRLALMGFDLRDD
jgi:GNAT superfamily N-acetyltransferase